MSSDVLSAADSFLEAMAGFDPELLSGVDCARVVKKVTTAVKAGEAVCLLASARAVASGAHKELGFNDGAAWMARQVGGTTGQARQALETAAGLDDCPGTRLAVLGGQLSLSQAGEIVRAQPETPGAEAELLDVARNSDLSQLRDKAREHRQANTDVNDLHRQQMSARHFRPWRDGLGMVRFTGALPPETGVAFINRLELDAQRARRAIQQAGGKRERFEAYAADALAAMATGEGPARATRADLVIVCDLFAWRRGHTHPGEVCQVIGGGPIPGELAHELGKDAFLKAVLHDGVALHTIKHFGRHFPAELRSALDLGPCPLSQALSAASAGAASASSTTTSTLSPTTARPHFPTSRPCAGTTIKPRPNETAKPGSSGRARHIRHKPRARHGRPSVRRPTPGRGLDPRALRRYRSFVASENTYFRFWLAPLFGRRVNARLSIERGLTRALAVASGGHGGQGAPRGSSPRGEVEGDLPAGCAGTGA
jgi:hypothetical protein